jgi:hypothetical protein
MRDVFQTVETVLFLGGFYVRWKRWPRPRGVLPILSLIGFILTTASALVAASSIVYAQATSGFAFYDPRLMRIFRLGGRLSISGTLFASIGAWRRSPIRWHAFCCALGILIFWVMAPMGE